MAIKSIRFKRKVGSNFQGAFHTKQRNVLRWYRLDDMYGLRTVFSGVDEIRIMKNWWRDFAGKALKCLFILKWKLWFNLISNKRADRFKLKWNLTDLEVVYFICNLKAQFWICCSSKCRSNWKRFLQNKIILSQMSFV